MNTYYITLCLKNGRMFSGVASGDSRYDAMMLFVKSRKVKFENILKYSIGVVKVHPRFIR